MAISCALGLAACLNYYGKKVHVDDALAAMDTCQMIDERRARNAASLASLTSYIESKTGHHISWPKGVTSGQRYALIRQECATLKRAFDQDSNWDNIEKWPY